MDQTQWLLEKYRITQPLKFIIKDLVNELRNKTQRQDRIKCEENWIFVFTYRKVGGYFKKSISVCEVAKVSFWQVEWGSKILEIIIKKVRLVGVWI